MNEVSFKIDNDILAHMLLSKLSPRYHPTRDLLAHTAETANTLLTLDQVFEHLQQLVLDYQPSATPPPAALVAERRPVPTYERCLNGTHNPLTSHTEAQCFQLHPELKKPRNNRSNN